MITPDYFWQDSDKNLDVFFNAVNTHKSEIAHKTALKLLQVSHKNPLYFGRIADYITIHYSCENTFSWSDWQPELWEEVHAQSHYFLQLPSVNSSICQGASHKTALRFLGAFNQPEDVACLLNYLNTSNFKTSHFKTRNCESIENERLPLCVWALSEAITNHAHVITTHEIVNWVVEHINKDCLLEYRGIFVGYLGHYATDILKWTKQHVHLLHKAEQEDILMGAISVKQKTEFYDAVFNNLSHYIENLTEIKEANSFYKLELIHKNPQAYLRSVEDMCWFDAEKELEGLPTIYRDYHLADKKAFFSEILLQSNIAIQAKISLFLKILKHKKGHAFFISPATYDSFIELLHRKLAESRELVLPEKLEIEEGIDAIKKLQNRMGKSAPEQWYQKWTI